MEAEETTRDTSTEPEVASFDMDKAADRIGEQLFPRAASEEVVDEAAPEVVAETKVPTDPAQKVSTETAIATDTTAPKSWPKDMHEHWGKTPKEVQAYWTQREKQMLDGLEQYKEAAGFAKTFKDVITPFAPLLQEQGLNPPQAVQALLHAQQRLTKGTPEQRMTAYTELGQRLGLSTATGSVSATPMDPTLEALQRQVQAMASNLTMREQAELQEAQTKITKEVDTFASDPAHPYFADVADDIVLLLKTGASLQEAYDKAVWTNPVTREKELQARFQTETAKQRETARLNALPKAKAVKSNIRSLDSRRAPTETLGTMEDTIKNQLSEIRQRVH